MTSKTASQAAVEPREPRGRRNPDTAALIQGLEGLRDGLFRRLEQIETLALEQTQLLEKDSSEREQALQERVSMLEASQARLQAESKRREQEWQTVLQQLEADRRLLAEAWERLEQEQIDAPREAHHPTGPAPPAVERPSVHRAPAEDPADDAVTQAILKQFQALKNDVRRNTKERNGR